MIKAKGKRGYLWIDIPAGESPTGKRIRLSTKTTDKAVANRVLGDVLAGVHGAGRTHIVTLAQLQDEALREHWAGTKAYDTCVINGEVIMSILGRNIDIKRIDKAAIRELRAGLKDLSYAPSTVNRKLSHLSKLLTLAEDWDYIEQAPRIKREKESGGREYVFTREVEAQLIQAALSYGRRSTPEQCLETADLFICLVDTGARLGEMLQLQPDRSVDFERNTIEFQWSTTKTSTTRRVPMTERVAAIMRRRQSGWTFTKASIESRFSKLRDDLGITNDECVMHAFRHTCASRLIEAGMDIYEVSKWLGHTSVETTQRYAHMFDQQLQHGVTKLGITSGHNYGDIPQLDQVVSDKLVITQGTDSVPIVLRPVGVYSKPLILNGARGETRTPTPKTLVPKSTA